MYHIFAKTPIIKSKKFKKGGVAKTSKSEAHSRAEAQVRRVFAPPLKCSASGATLAGDSTTAEQQRKAGKKLGSFKCKIPARRRKAVHRSKHGKGYEKKRK
jgi:hypothetical protein